MDRPRWLFLGSWAVAGLALCYGLWCAWSRAWVCDDAFISFRYCQNLLDGLGLVYNAGERVEGYTNFLWVMFLSLGMLLGGEPIFLGQVLGLAFFVGTFVVLAATAKRMGVIPIAAIGFALHEHAQLFATCGLETSMFMFLVTIGLVQTARAERPVQFFRAGLFLILATMTRPDGALFYALASFVVTIVTWRRRDRAGFLGFALPFVLLYAPYFFWKLSYYGYPFPNTYYAKSAADPYPDQGLYYVGLFFSCYYYMVPALVVPLVLVFRPWKTAGGDRPKSPGVGTARGNWLVLLFTLPFLGYVIWVGGDFMFSRFCLPVTPALLLGLQYLARPRAWLAGTVGAVVIAGSFLTNYPAEALKHGNPRGVVEERVTYPAWYVDCYRILGEKLREVFAGRDLRVAIGGGQAMLGYFGQFPYVLELNGLTDAFIAHRPVGQRGQPGHEKKLPLDHPYLRERGVDLIVGAYMFHTLPKDRVGPQRHFEFRAEDVPFFGKPVTGFVKATLLTYDEKLLEGLADRKDVRFTDFQGYLAAYAAKLDSLDPAVVAKDLRVFDAFYFEPNDCMDAPVRRRILTRARQ